MIRTEEIEKASVIYQIQKRPMAIGGDLFEDMVYMANINPSFIAGAKWADEHPREGLWDKEKVCEYLKMVLETTDANSYETYIRSLQFNNVDELIEYLCEEMEE